MWRQLAEDERRKLTNNLKTRSEKRRFLKLLNKYLEKTARSKLADFVKDAWKVVEPGTKLKWNWHLDTVCGYLEAFRDRKIKRLIINIPPGTMKSLITSVFFAAWVWIDDPSHRFLSIANEIDLSLRDSGKSKLVIESDWYQKNWEVALKRSHNQKKLYVNCDLGHRQSIGITGNITGKRGDSLLIDDPHNAMGALSDADRTHVITTYDQEVSTRLNSQDDSGICLIMQRLHTQDLTGHLLNKSKTHWVHLVIPMEYEGVPTFDAGKDIGRPDLNDPRVKEGDLLFPALFSRDAVEALKEDLGDYGAAGQLQQRPVPSGGGILKTKWWKVWPKDKKIPACHHVFASWDTAYTAEDLKKNAHSAMTLWGVFWHEQKQRDCLMLLSAWNGQVDYPDLREKAKEIEKIKKPDAHFIEKKASGISLVQDMRRAGIKIRTFTPGKDKVARAYSVSAMLQSGLVYAPVRKWAKRMIDYVATFPNGDPVSFDFTDTVTQALIYLRKGWYVSHPDDDEHDEINEDEVREPAYG